MATMIDLIKKKCLATSAPGRNVSRSVQEEAFVAFTAGGRMELVRVREILAPRERPIHLRMVVGDERCRSFHCCAQRRVQETGQR